MFTEADPFHDLEPVQREAALGKAEHEEEREALAGDEPLQHPADGCDLGHLPQLRADGLVDRTVADVEAVRLANHKVGRAPR